MNPRKPRNRTNPRNPTPRISYEIKKAPASRNYDLIALGIPIYRGPSKLSCEKVASNLKGLLK